LTNKNTRQDDEIALKMNLNMTLARIYIRIKVVLVFYNYEKGVYGNIGVWEGIEYVAKGRMPTPSFGRGDNPTMLLIPRLELTT
jgi:hypothetical protein